MDNNIGSIDGSGDFAGLSPGKDIIECASIDRECMQELQGLVT